MTQIKDLLEQTTSPKRGAFGEALVKCVLTKQGHSVTKLHRNGADIEINGYGRVDIKVRKCLNQRQGAKFYRVSKSHELEDTSYLYVVLWENCVEIICERKRKSIQNLHCSLTWNDVDRFFQESRQTLDLSPSNKDSAQIKSVIKDIKIWAKEELGMIAKVIYREGRIAQSSMSKQGWGPDNFYQSTTSKRKCDLVVLLYFDKNEVYEIFSYPINHVNKIQWISKSVGPNKAETITFNPLQIDHVYKFQNMLDLKNSFAKRFVNE